MPTMNEYATELFMGVYSSLLQLDTFSLPLEKVCLDECDRQVLLGRDFIEALVRWAYIFPGKIDMIDTTIIHDVRRIIKRVRVSL